MKVLDEDRRSDICGGESHDDVEPLRVGDVAFEEEEEALDDVTWNRWSKCVERKLPSSCQPPAAFI